MTPRHLSTSHEWLETDGLDGFTSGTAAGIRTRRYHALLLVATTPPTGRFVLVNGLGAWVETPGGQFQLSSQSYAPGIIGGDGIQHLEAFGWEPWPHWIFKLADGTRIEQEIFVAKGEPMTCISWKVLGPQRGVNLFVRPFLSGRDYHFAWPRDALRRRGIFCSLGQMLFQKGCCLTASRIRVSNQLLTPLGLRSLAQNEPGYVGRYCGGVAQRDGAYHFGTVWPWLLGPFVEAWVRVRGGTKKAKRIARKRSLEPVLQHMEEAGLGHISEIADAEG